ncbi:MAG: DUF960 domain-containing protein [Leptospiraceae bacterium]|nr:DUF960 domain-containing protein [Leptospiraceae bacterium]
MPTKWVLQPQEQPGTYRFDGNPYMTCGIHEELSPEEIDFLISQIHERVKSGNGADYLQVFVHSVSGRRIFVIDNLNDSSKTNASPGFINANNYFTIMFAEEY